MRNVARGAVLMASITLSIGLTAPAHATDKLGAESERVVAFTPPIASEHGSVLAHPRVPTGPTQFELDIMW